MTTDPKPETIVAWAKLIRSARVLLDQVECDLKQAELPPLAWYDVLHELAGAGGSGLRPYVLVERMLLEQYNTSRLLERIERQGLIDRNKCPVDGRGQIVCITKAGKQMRKRMWVVYGAAIARHFGDKLNAKQTRKLTGLLSQISPVQAG